MRETDCDDFLRVYPLEGKHAKESNLCRSHVNQSDNRVNLIRILTKQTRNRVNLKTDKACIWHRWLNHPLITR